ncbi:MAG: sugar isomerase domain-containing protein [Acidobacteria bacterium]|nr:sugar isomerase domain-containing protein [Acidobacteriota bacterium]
MSAVRYFDLAQGVYDKIRKTQVVNIEKAGEFAADSIARGGLAHLFGSGHSVIPVLDVFPRYGSFAGFHPLMDSRLMWTQVLGSGGVRELLKLERTEGYVAEFLANFKFEAMDTMVVYSHGGLNAAPVEVALHAKALGLKVVAVTSLENARLARATHSSGKKLADLGDVTIDNCCPPEDALVEVAGVPVAASSTLAAIAISMALVAETAARLEQRGVKFRAFVSPNVASVPPENNRRVFDDYAERLAPRLR